MAAGAARRDRARRAATRIIARRPSQNISAADGGEQDDVGQRDHQIELAERAQQREGPDPERGADGAAA